MVPVMEITSGIGAEVAGLQISLADLTVMKHYAPSIYGNWYWDQVPVVIVAKGNFQKSLACFRNGRAGGLGATARQAVFPSSLMKTPHAAHLCREVKDLPC